MNYITRKGRFDAGHRVMHQRFACRHLHGHDYHYELSFYYNDALAIGYAVDFKEIKRVACAWIEECFDHTFIANPMDEHVLAACEAIGSHVYKMHLVDGEGFCNPTAENIAKELYFAVTTLMNDANLALCSVRLYETPNCFVDCLGLTLQERAILQTSSLLPELEAFKELMGKEEYDDRNLKNK